MSDDNTLEVNDDTSPKALREALEKANKQLAEFRKMQEQADAEKRTTQLTEIFKSKGLKESAVAHFTGDVSEENVVKWATDLGLLSTSTDDQKPDPNAEAAARAVAAAGGSASVSTAGAEGSGRRVADPFKAMELMQQAGFTYADGVAIGIFPERPDVVGLQHQSGTPGH